MKRVLSLGGLFCGASGALPPSLPDLFPLGGSLFSALEVPRGEHTLKGLAAVRGPSRTGTIPSSGNRTGIPQRAVQVQENSAALLFLLSAPAEIRGYCPFLVRTRPVGCSFPSWSSTCLCSTSASAGIGSVRKFPGQCKR